MKKPTKELKIGLMVVLTIVVAYFAINYLRDKDIFNKENEYRIVYDEVDGLKTSASIYIRGYRAGTVERVEFSPETEDFYVICSVDKRFRIPEDSRFEIYSSDLMGGKSIRVLEGISENYAVSGSVLEGGVAADMMGALMEKLPGVLDNVNSTLDTLSAAINSVHRMLDDNAGDVRAIVASLVSAAAGIDGMVEEAGELIPDLRIFVDNMKSLSASLESGKEDISGIISDLSEVSSQLKDAGLGQIASSLSSILSSLENGEGSVGKLLYDDSLYARVDSLVADVDSLVNAIKENPKKYIRISVF